jgi:hypothetical protein
MRITKSLKLSFILGVLFAFHLTCSSDFGEPGELGSISFDIIFNNNSSQSSRQSHDLIDPVKDAIKITKTKSVSSDINIITITIPGVDSVDVLVALSDPVANGTIKATRTSTESTPGIVIVIMLISLETLFVLVILIASFTGSIKSCDCLLL